MNGTTFHHGGFYPAYTTGVLAVIGQFIAFTNNTDFELTEEAATYKIRIYCHAQLL